MSQNILSDKNPYTWWPTALKGVKPEDLTPEARSMIATISRLFDEQIERRRREKQVQLT